MTNYEDVFEAFKPLVCQICVEHQQNKLPVQNSTAFKDAVLNLFPSTSTSALQSDGSFIQDIGNQDHRLIPP